MTYEQALKVIRTQERSLRKIDGLRFEVDGYEYRVTYAGGFACYVGIDRREIGRRVFKYFGGFGAYHCSTVEEVLEEIKHLIDKKKGA